MAKLYSIGFLCCLLAALACEQTRADDPIVDQITTLEEQLFYSRESNGLEVIGEAGCNQILERLIELESLVAQRADDEQYGQLLADVRELIGFSHITDEKCRAGDSIGIMFDYRAYYDIPYAIRGYWAFQANRQLNHCGMRLNEALARRGDDSLELFMRLFDNTAIAHHINGTTEDRVNDTLEYLNSIRDQGYSESAFISEDEFASKFDKYVKRPCEEIMETYEPWIELIRLSKAVSLSGVRVHDQIGQHLIYSLPFCQEVSAIREIAIELHKGRVLGSA